MAFVCWCLAAGIGRKFSCTLPGIKECPPSADDIGTARV